MNEVAEALLIAVIGSGALSAVVQFALNAIKEKTRKPSVMEVGVRLLLQDKLVYHMDKECDKGYTTIETRQLIEKMYKTYKALGGNGDMEVLKEEYDELKANHKGE